MLGINKERWLQFSNWDSFFLAELLKDMCGFEEDWNCVSVPESNYVGYIEISVL